MEEGTNGLNFASNSAQKSSPTTKPSLGTLQFSVSYVSASQELRVTVIRASDLPVPTSAVEAASSSSGAGAVDSYVKLELLPEKRQRVKTRVVRQQTSPQFAETFTFAGLSPMQLRATSLHFLVVGFDRHSRDSLIGELLCSLADLQLNVTPEVTITGEISRRSFNVSFRAFSPPNGSFMPVVGLRPY